MWVYRTAAFDPFRRHIIARALFTSVDNCATKMANSGNMGEDCSRFGYAQMKTGNFVQEAPVLHNPFDDDPILEKALKKLLPPKVCADVCTDLRNFGSRVVNELEALGREAELNPPKLEQLDAWGNRLDRLIVAEAWNRLKRICAEEGLVALAYDESRDAVWRRVHQIAKLYLFSPSAGLVTCPAAMTDGAAKTIKELNLAKLNKEFEEAYRRLTSRKGSEAWTSGQWMTEKRGGSDVNGGCDTYAVHHTGNQYKLYGHKWFSSAVDADVALTLARIVRRNSDSAEGSGGLTLFYVRLREVSTGKLNGIEMVRLKNKLGTKQLPTAELILDATNAFQISEEGRGVAAISNMLNITRIHNAVASVAAIRRMLSLARDYATRRVVFGRKLAEWPLHLSTLSKMEIEARACLLLLIETARLLGVQESGKAAEEEKLVLQLMTPVLKLYTGKRCVPLISECLECFGGQGYIEDTGIPTILRDAQVTPIWEGTTNVLALYVMRVLHKNKNAMSIFRSYIEAILSSVDASKSLELADCKRAVVSALKVLEHTLSLLSMNNLKNPMQSERAAREIAFAIARTCAGALMTSLAADSVASSSDIVAASRFCLEEKLTNINPEQFLSSRTAIDKELIYENYMSVKSKF